METISFQHRYRLSLNAGGADRSAVFGIVLPWLHSHAREMAQAASREAKRCKLNEFTTASVSVGCVSQLSLETWEIFSTNAGEILQQSWRTSPSMLENFSISAGVKRKKCGRRGKWQPPVTFCWRVNPNRNMVFLSLIRIS